MHYISLRVMNMVRRTLVEHPDMGNEALYKAAVALDPEIAKLTLRQFHARYPLQVRRRELGGLPPRPAKSEPVREERGAEEVAKRAPVRAQLVESPVDENGAAPWPMAFHPEAAEVRPAPEKRRRRRRKRKARERAIARPASVVTNASEKARHRVRRLLLRFATDVAAADTVDDMVGALVGIEDHVSALVSAANEPR